MSTIQYVLIVWGVMCSCYVLSNFIKDLSRTDNDLVQSDIRFINTSSAVSSCFSLLLTISPFLIFGAVAEKNMLESDYYMPYDDYPLY